MNTNQCAKLLELLAYEYDHHEKTVRRNLVGINMNVVKYGSFSRSTRKSTYPVSMSKYGYDYQCE